MVCCLVQQTLRTKHSVKLTSTGVDTQLNGSVRVTECLTTHINIRKTFEGLVMPKYAYLVVSDCEELWIKDGHFEVMSDNDKPQEYAEQSATSLKQAKEIWIDRLLKFDAELVIYKFDSKPPYKYYGKVQ